MSLMPYEESVRSNVSRSSSSALLAAISNSSVLASKRTPELHSEHPRPEHAEQENSLRTFAFVSSASVGTCPADRQGTLRHTAVTVLLRSRAAVEKTTHFRAKQADFSLYALILTCVVASFHSET